ARPLGRGAQIRAGVGNLYGPRAPALHEHADPARSRPSRSWRGQSALPRCSGERTQRVREEQRERGASSRRSCFGGVVGEEKRRQEKNFSQRAPREDAKDAEKKLLRNLLCGLCELCVSVLL